MRDKESSMKRKMDGFAASIYKNEEIVDILDSLLTESDDRAFVVCSAYECLHNNKGRCTIHPVKGRRKILSNGRCAEYVV